MENKIVRDEEKKTKQKINGSDALSKRTKYLSNRFALGVAAAIAAAFTVVVNTMSLCRLNAILLLLLFAIIVHKLMVGIYDLKLNDFIISPCERCKPLYPILDRWWTAQKIIQKK